MPAPTALLRRSNELAEAETTLTLPSNDGAIVDVSNALLPATTVPSDPSITNEMQVDEQGRPQFSPTADFIQHRKVENRKILVPPHRVTPLKAAWPKIYPPLVENLGLQVRMNLKGKAVELRTSKYTEDSGALQKGADFVQSFALGFEVEDAIALLRLDDLYIETFEIKDIKTLNGDHKSRAIGRIAGKDGKTKFAIENASRTRVVLADQKIHILGGYKEIHIAREAICSLVLGSPPGKVYGNLKTVASRMRERF